MSEEYTEITIPDESFVYRTRFILKEDIKIDRHIWRFHRFDKDPSPSKPHGHCMKTGEKLDVYTGEVYSPFGNGIIGQIKEDSLKEIQRILKERGLLE